MTKIKKFFQYLGKILIKMLEKKIHNWCKIKENILKKDKNIFFNEREILKKEQFWILKNKFKSLI